MKKKTLVLLGIVALAMMMTAACSKEKPATGSTAGSTTEEADGASKETEEIMGWLDDSAKAFADADVYEEKSEGSQNYDDGSATTNRSTTIYDKANGIAETISAYENPDDPYRTWYSKEGDTYYEINESKSYDADGVTVTGSSYNRWPVEADQIEYVESSVMKKDFSYYQETEDYAFENFVCEQEGEEEINGVKAIKVKITFDRITKAQEPQAREEFLTDRFTEEEIAAVPGASEALDAYLVELNKFYEKDSTLQMTEEHYFRADNHLLFASPYTYSEEDEEPEAEETKALSEASDAFYNLMYATDANADTPEQTSFTTTTYYYINEECDAMDPIPTNYTDYASMDEYYNQFN